MKQRILISGLSLLLTFSLAGCGGQLAQQEPQEPDQGKVQQTEPVSTTPQFESMEVKNENDTAIPLADLEDIEPDEAGGAGTFEGAGSVESGLEEVQLFTEVNETVYATGTVNLRNGAGTSFDKVGSLNAGDLVTRIGIGTAEAEGWSRIQLSNDNIVYVSNSYLSTTKPVTQQPSGGNTQGKPSGQTQQQQQTQQTPQGGSISLKDAAEQQGVQVTEQNTGKVWDQAFYDSLNPQQQAAYKNADDSTRIQMKDIIEVNRQLDQQGYEGNGDLTQEQVRETWGNIIVN